MKTVGVVFGGKSGEHEVSLVSATAIINNMPKSYKVVQIGIDKEGTWYMGPHILNELKNGGISKSKPVRIEVKGGEKACLSTEDETVEIEVFFPALHGTYGEDGTIQGFFEMLGTPYVGANVLGSAVAMDKVVAKKIWESVNLPVVPYVHFHENYWEAERKTIVRDIEEEIGYPCFVKPANLGSSVGINKAKSVEELEAAIETALSMDHKVLVEQGLDVREMECAVKGNERPVASTVGEVIVGGEFYDYNDKYVDGISHTDIPADINANTMAQIKKLSIEAYRALGCIGLARVDTFVQRETGKLYLNEINTMPGFTDISMYPKLWEYDGVSFSVLIDELITYAFDAYKSKRSLNTHFEQDSDWFKG